MREVAPFVLLFLVGAIVVSAVMGLFSPPTCSLGLVRTFDQGGWHCEENPSWWRWKL